MSLLTKAIVSKKFEISDSSIFTQVSVAEDKHLNFIVNVEKHITDLLKGTSTDVLKMMFQKVLFA